MRLQGTNKVSIWVLAFFIFVFFESVFLSNGNIIFLLLGAGFVYYGVQKRSKWTTVLGLFFVVIALLSLWSLRLLILGAALYVLINMWRGMPTEQIMKPFQKFQKETPNGIWKNRLFSIQTSPFSTYEWEDIHMQGIFGDIHVDATDTVLPKGASFISIRQGFGKIAIDVPYEIPVRVHYTTLFGEARIFHYTPARLLNESIHLKDSYEGKQPNDPELIISLSTWMGDVEVRRK